MYCIINSFSSLSYDRSKASSKESSPHSAIQSFLLQMRVSSPFLKVIQQPPTSSSSSSCHLYLPFYLYIKWEIDISAQKCNVCFTYYCDRGPEDGGDRPKHVAQVIIC
jgi:hypothetical protein